MNDSKNVIQTEEIRHNLVTEAGENPATDPVVDPVSEPVSVPVSDDPVSGEPVSEEPISEEPKKKSRYDSLEDILRDYGSAFHIALNDTTLHAPLQSYAYDITRISEGKAIFDRAQQLYWDQNRAYDRLANGTLIYYEAHQNADHEFMRLLYVARVAFRDDTLTANKLRLFERRPRLFSKWLQAAYMFYNGAQSEQEILDGFALFNVTPENLQHGEALVQEAHIAYAERERLKSEAQNFTEKRNLEFQNLKNWMTDFRSIARLAFENDRQILEKFGVVVR